MFILVFSLVGCKVNSSNTPSKIESLNGEVVELKIGDNTSRVNSIEEAVEIAYQSVVVINATSTTSTSSGSGVVIGHSENYTFIVTCCHVVEGYKNYEVITSTGTLFDASLVGGDPMTDLAVIAIEKTDLPEVTLIEDSSTLKIGSDAIAIGNPLGTLGGTVTTGIISATSRNIKMSDGSVHTLIQTDAAINSGNSGGGLFNNQGQLIGIVSAKYSATGVEGLGFAIPSNTVRTIVTDLIKNGYVSGVTNVVGTYKDTMGLFHYGRFIQIFTAIINIVLSISLGKICGLAGILLATVIARSCTHLWYTPYVVYKYGFKKKPIEYLWMYIRYLIIGGIAFIICNSVFYYVTGNSFKTLVLKIILCTLVSNCVYIAFLYKTKEFKRLKSYIKVLWKKIQKKK